MPPTRKFQKENIINTAYEIVKDEGIEELNARRIAKELGCSVQPIFHNFKNMEEVKSQVYQKMANLYHEYMLSGINKEKAYKQMGLSYIQFAKDYPNFFKMMFMEKTILNAENFIMSDTNIIDELIKAGQQLTGLSYEEQKKFHVKVWVFTHGIACLVSTGTVNFTSEEIEELLEQTVREMVIGHKLKKEGKENNE